MSDKISIKGARQHNLKNIDVELDHDSLTVITGVSGSGKSSLAFETICKEGQRLFLETLPSYARLYSGKLNNPKLDSISGLRATVSLNQHKTTGNIRSTVGTLTELYDLLRLLFARLGDYSRKDNLERIDRSLFSFNSTKGACPECNGLGIVEKISSDLLIKDSRLSIREGALIPTTPSGYIVYSQVTLDILNKICIEHGFNIDIPWKDLTEENKNIIYFGSNQIKVPFGKHTLESRMKWTGITAKPREEGYYRGIVTIMEEILKRDRNKNILRFVESAECPSCNGDRLNETAKSVFFKNKRIPFFNRLSIYDLKEYFSKTNFSEYQKEIIDPIKALIINRTKTLEDLGLSYLTLNRASSTLSGGELQRIRLSTQTGNSLSDILYLFDEPTIGLHQRDNLTLIKILENIKLRGNTVCIIEHDKDVMGIADKIIDIGPRAGINGGDILLNDTPQNLQKYSTETALFFTGKKRISKQDILIDKDRWIKISGVKKNNLKNISISLRCEALNIVTGVSGAGKSTLVKQIIGPYVKQYLSNKNYKNKYIKEIKGLSVFKSIIEFDSSPIGRTSRSNPATYTQLFDYIRDIFSQLKASKEQKLKKSHFSFNVPGGRCEECQGAGIRSVGMFFLGDVKITCTKCHGKRFLDNILNIKYRGKNVYDVLDLSFKDAENFFKEHPNPLRIIKAVNSLGLGYIKLGQPATTLSGGEAQRIKLAAQLSKNTKGNTLYLFDEPSIGLSDFDIQILMNSIFELIRNGNTVILIEHNLDIISLANHIIDLGPESGIEGGYCVAEGSVNDIINSKNSITGKCLKDYLKNKKKILYPTKKNKYLKTNYIELKNVNTNNLKNLTVKIPKKKLTVITGVSGSGKSSLAFDSIYNEAHKKFIERLSIYARQFLRSIPPSDIEEASGLTPSIGIKQNIHINNPRSTVGTMSGIYDRYRLLYSRVGVFYCPICNSVLKQKKCPNCNLVDNNNKKFYSDSFSFNNQEGACLKCKGMGVIISTDPKKLISDPNLPFFNGAMDHHNTGKFYGDKYGQYKSILFKVGELKGIDYSKPIIELSDKALEIALYGTGDRIYSVNWEFKRKNRTGTFKMDTQWKGFINLIDDEYSRKVMKSGGKKIADLMQEIKCPKCMGKRLSKEILSIKFLEKDISAISNLSINKSLLLFENKKNIIKANPVSSIIIKDIKHKMEIIKNAGLGYLTPNRRLDSLSHGEYRRLQLSVQMVNGLQDMTYIIDEPTQGLHQRDIDRLINLINKLKKNNTIIIVEHDLKIIESADHIIDIGPGSGHRGGNIIAAGTLNQIKNNKKSITGKSLKITKRTPQIKKRKKLNKGFTLHKININNIKGVSAKIPIDGLIVFTGVSGSGKTSLLFNAIYESLNQRKPVFADSIKGNFKFDKVIKITQSAIGNTPLSNPATYTGIFDLIRAHYAGSEYAKKNNLSKKHFSFKTKDGQCKVCKGIGKTKISMDFLSDIWINCEECFGKRYKKEITKCKINGISIDQLLEKTINQAKLFFNNSKVIKNKLEILSEIGLGYLKLGQGFNTLSGGEAQRLKIVKELLKSNTKKEKTLYLLDEPTTGLHIQDIEVLISLFEKLKKNGDTLMIIEHDMNIIANADWIIDMGPEGGDKGGNIIAEGTPEDIIRNKNSYTGLYLEKHINSKKLN